MKKLLFGLLCGIVLLSGCTPKEEEETSIPSGDVQTQVSELSELPQFPSAYDEEAPVVVMETSKGNISLVLFPKEAPKACENFMTHAKNGYYDGVTFHRVMNEFMIQGGDPEGTGRGGESIWGKPFEDEFSRKLFHFRGALSMANAGSNTNGSQFFIVQATTLAQDITGFPQLADAKYREIGGTPWLDGQHTVFGQVIEGMETVDAIAALENSSEVAVINKMSVTTYREWKK